MRYTSFGPLEIQALLDLMKKPHRLDIGARFLNGAGIYQLDLTGRVMDGMITVDADADVASRGADLTVLDPTGMIPVGPTGSGSIFTGDILQLDYIVSDPLYIDSYVIPVFTGPIDTAKRDDGGGITIVIKALGKDALNLNNFDHFFFPRGTFIDDVINFLGENRLYIEYDRGTMPSGGRLVRDLFIDRNDRPADILRALAMGFGLNFRFSPNGEAEFYKFQQNVVHVFDNSVITKAPTVNYDLQNTVNAVQAVGPSVPGQLPIQAYAFAPPGHPLSAQSLGRGGEPRYLWETFQNDVWTVQDWAQQWADYRLRAGLAAGIEVNFEGLPMPLLQENDMVSINTPRNVLDFMMKKWTIPLTAGVDSSYGNFMGPKVREGSDQLQSIEIEPLKAGKGALIENPKFYDLSGMTKKQIKKWKKKHGFK